MTPNESRPGGGPGAAQSVVATHPQDTEGRGATRPTTAQVQDAIPAYVLIVETPTMRVTRRVYLSLHSAVKACERARARGHAATLAMAHYTSGGDAL